MKQVYVNLLSNGVEFEDDFLVQDMQVLMTKTNKPYAMFKAADKTGSIKAMMFDYDAEEHKLLKNGDVVRLIGKCEVYNGNLQIKVSDVFAAAPLNLNDFVKATKYDIEGMWKNIVHRVNNFENHNIKVVAEELLLHPEWSKLFKKCPAATGMHHAFVGGLLEHTEQMVRVGDALLDLSFFGTELDKDLCIFGLMFHDFGKIFEYSCDAGFAKIESGILVGHIAMVSAMIYAACEKHGVPEYERNHMMHVILAHHGKIEWGSPVQMSTPEAVFVHHVDHLHGDVFGVLQRIENAQGAQFVRHSNDMKDIVTKRFTHEQQIGF